jgi:hypothetical protein
LTRYWPKWSIGDVQGWILTAGKWSIAMRVRFSLRVFLTCFTMVAVGLGVGANFVYRVKDQVRRHKAAVAQLEKFRHVIATDARDDEPLRLSIFAKFARTLIDSAAYPEVRYLALTSDQSVEERKVILNAARDLGRIYRIRIGGNVPPSEVLKLVSFHPDLSSFEIDSMDSNCLDQVLATTKSLESFSTDQAISDSVARKLEQLPKLRTLSADISQLTSGAESLAHLPALEAVLLRGSIKTHKQLTSLFRNSRLAELSLFDCHTDDGVMAAFEEARGLRRIFYWSRDTEPQKNFLRSIAKIPALRELEIYVDEGLDTENLAFLAQRGVIEQLKIVGQPLSKRDLAALKKARRLQSLIFYGELEDDDICDFLVAVPQCKVEMHAVHPSDREPDTKNYTLVNGAINIEKLATIIWCRKSSW